MSSSQDQNQPKKQNEDEKENKKKVVVAGYSWHTISLYALLIGVSVGFSIYIYKQHREKELISMRLREKTKMMNRFRATPGGTFAYN
jgi:hypothetical protein